MSTYTATISWARGSQKFTDSKYKRVHQWEFDGGQVIRASASPNIVSTPYSDPSAVDPEETFVASISSCHMLWFLSLAAKEGFVVEHYDDHATGMLEKDECGNPAITKVILHPAVKFAKESSPSKKNDTLHHQAHEKCFIANSVKTEIQIASTIKNSLE